MHAARPTADLGEDMAAMLYQEAGQLDDIARANAIRQAADRIELYREALVNIAGALVADNGLAAMLRETARALLSRSGDD